MINGSCDPDVCPASAGKHFVRRSLSIIRLSLSPLDIDRACSTTVEPCARFDLIDLMTFVDVGVGGMSAKLRLGSVQAVCYTPQPECHPPLARSWMC